MTLLTDHYRTLVDERGYEPATFAVGDRPAAAVSRRFVCAENGRAFASSLDRPSLVTAGISTTGPPHVGTLGQLLTAVRLQRAGVDVQLVLADLAAYLGAGVPLAGARALADRYRTFARRLGFDHEDGVVRTQGESRDVLHSAALLARYYVPDERDDVDPTAFERALSAAYERADTPGGETTRFADDLTGLLLVADSLHPVVAGEYENVCLVVGADNAGLARRFERVLDRSPHDATVAGLYTKLVPGLDGHPKLSKRIPESRFGLDLPAETVREEVLDIDGGVRPEASVVYQMMQLASPYGPAKLDRLADLCADGGEAWTTAKREYADYLTDVARQWPD